MFKLIVAITVLSICFNVTAQAPVKNNTGCSFLKNIRFKNGLDTLVVKATYWGITRISGDISGTDFVNKLIKMHGGLIQRNTFRSQIEFYPENCSKAYDGPLIYLNHNILNLNPGIAIYVTCVAFKGYKYDNDGTPYFIVINVSTKKP